MKHPVVTDAVVVGLSKGSGVEVYAAILMEDPGAAAEAISWANGQLADHQRIQGFTVWPDEDFPRTHTLKVKKGVVLDLLQGTTSTAPAAIPASKEAASGARSLERLVAEVGGLPLEQVTPEKALGLDLNVDSLGRVELLSAVEDELGVYLDESRVGPDTTLEQLKEMVGQGSAGASPPSFPHWGMSWWCCIMRGAIQRALVFPLLRLTNRLQVVGKENLEDLPGSVLFAANHCLFLDNGLIVKAMPLKVRRRLAIAAAAENMRNNGWTIFNPLVGNGFPFDREGNIRASLDNLGRILDEGWSVLIYPEGELTIGGPMKPFKSGPSFVAVEGRVPVVPLRLHVRRLGSPRLITFMRRSNVEIRFGKPLTFPPGTSYEDATQAIEDAVRAL